MKVFPHALQIISAIAFFALPFSAAAAGTLLFAAGLGAVICRDYSHRYRGLQMPRLQSRKAASTKSRPPFRAPPLSEERLPLAA